MADLDSAIKALLHADPATFVRLALGRARHAAPRHRTQPIKRVCAVSAA